MKKVCEFISKLPKWVKVISPIALLVILFVIGAAASMPETFPEDAIVSVRNESHGIYYKNRAFVEISTMNNFSDATVKRINVNKGILDQNAVNTNFYSAESLDPRYVLLKRNYKGDLSIYVSFSEIPLYKGKDLYENILHLSENTVSFNYQIRKSRVFSEYDYYYLKKENETLFKELFAYLNEADFAYRESFEEVKDESLDSPPYYIECEFENGFVYNIRLYEGGYVVPCGAGDICQKIPDEMYNKLEALLSDESSGEYGGNDYQNEPITDIENLKNTEDLKRYLPTYLPGEIIVDYRGVVSAEFEIRDVYLYYAYDLETGRITQADNMSVYYTHNNSGYGITANIIKKNSAHYFNEHNKTVKIEDFTLDWLYSNCEVSKTVKVGVDDEIKVYSCHISVDFGEAEVRIDTLQLSLEEVYKMVNQ